MDYPRLDIETPEAAGVQEPVNLHEVKKHLKQTIDVDDDEIFRLMSAARAHAENFTKRAFVARTATYILKRFVHRIRLPYGKTQSVTSVAYYDTAGELQTLAFADSPTPFQVELTDDEGGIIQPLRNQVWPLADTESIAPVTITFEAGFGDPGDVPRPIRHAIALQVAEWYDARSNLEAPAPLQVGNLFERALLPYTLP